MSITPQTAEFFSLEWSVVPQAQLVNGPLAAVAALTFPQPGCYTVSVSVLFKDTVTRSASRTIAAGGATCD